MDVIMNLAETCGVLAQMLPGDYKISDNFKVRELSCRHCGLIFVTPVLIEMLERLRKIVGVPLEVNSGYRCSFHNVEIHGSPHSKHCLGMAADINVPDKYRMNPNEFIDAAEAVALEVRGGYHYYVSGRFVHIDCWAWPKSRRW